MQSLAGLRIEKDLPYKTGVLSDDEQQRCRLDLYLPAKNGFPVCLWFHGGGLTMGDKADGTMIPLGMTMARLGIGFVAANYRFSPKVTFPAYAQDAAAAFAWVKANLAPRGGDVTRTFVTGHSAGGYLAALIGMDPHYLGAHGLQLSEIAGLFCVSPQVFTHFTVRAERGVKNPQTTAIIDDAAPCYHARAQAPPVLIAVGDNDIPTRVEENQYFIAMLRHLKHPSARFQLIPGRDHASIVDRMIEQDDVVQQAMADFVRNPGR